MPGFCTPQNLHYSNLPLKTCEEQQASFKIITNGQQKTFKPSILKKKVLW